MTASVKSSGTQTATLTTEHRLATVTDPGCYGLQIDVNALVDGETLEIFVYGIVLAAGTERQIDHFLIENATSDKIKYTLFYVSPISIGFAIKQTGGTGRSFPWSVNQA